MTNKAEESAQVKRARRKIRERILTEREQMTPVSIQKTAEAIQLWIERHNSERIALKDRTIYRDAATSKSRFVVHLLHKLETTATPSETPGVLEGRITKSEVQAQSQKGLSSNKKVKSKSK